MGLKCKKQTICNAIKTVTLRYESYKDMKDLYTGNYKALLKILFFKRSNEAERSVMSISQHVY